MTKNLEKFKEVDGKWPLFQITRLTRGPTYFHNSKFKLRIQIQKKITILCTSAVFKKKKKQNKTKRNISYVHPMKRMDEVGQKRTGNNYRVVGSWGGGAR